MERSPRSGAYRIVLVVAGLVVLVDQITKQIALATLDAGAVHIIEGILSFRLTYNPGGAFGILQSLPGLFLVATIAIVAVILLWARSVEDRGLAAALGLVLGGGLGNLFDRLLRDTDGRVVDFIDLHVWPVFNVADACIVTGVALVVLMGARASRAEHG